MVRQDVLYPVYFGRRPGGNLAQSINIRLHTLAFLLRPLLLQGSDVESAVHWDCRLERRRPQRAAV
jgi:hypothetical protein